MSRPGRRARAPVAPLAGACVLLALASAAAPSPPELSLSLPLGSGLTPAERERFAPSPGDFAIADDPSLPILASVLSLPEGLVPRAEAHFLLAALAAHAPERDLFAFADRDLQADVRAGEWPRLRRLPRGGRSFSPWPRDPFFFARGLDGGLLLVARPDPQPSREDDLLFAPALAAALPAGLMGSRPTAWTLAPLPFHNGQLLVADGRLWASLHSLEPLILRRLGIPRVPVASFATRAGALAYLDAARAAAAELGALFGLPVRFVHPLPAEGSDADLAALMTRFGGGAGYDLDSLLTLVPRRTGAPAALVADLGEGEALLRSLGAEGAAALASFWGVEADLDALLVAQGAPRGRALQGFLDTVAAHLADEGLEVRRLPLLRLPTAFLRDGVTREYEEFLLGWNNVVLAPGPDGLRAEGFASGSDRADATAASVYAAAGAELVLLPPLRESVRRNGGYRCATNHLRAPGGDKR
jgi:hypothetical protein